MRRLLIGGLLALLPGAVLRAQPLDWPSLPYDYVAQGESLRDVLANFGANYDASVIVSDKVNDQVSGRFDLESPQAFLQLMASLYNLGWYYDGTVLYVFKTTEMQSRLVRLEQVGEAELKRALTAAGIWEPRFGWRADPSGRLVHVSGPGRYLELVEQTAQVLEQQYTLRSEKTGDLSVEIFPLRWSPRTARSSTATTRSRRRASPASSRGCSAMPTWLRWATSRASCARDRNRAMRWSRRNRR